MVLVKPGALVYSEKVLIYDVKNTNPERLIFNTM